MVCLCPLHAVPPAKAKQGRTRLHFLNRAVPPSHAKKPHSHSAAHALPSPSHRNSPARHDDPPHLQKKQNTTTIIIITHRKKKRDINAPGTPRERCNSSWACLRIPAANSGSASAGTSATARSTSGNLRKGEKEKSWWAFEPERREGIVLRYRSSSWSSSRWSVSAALR